MNLVPLRTLARGLGISRGFWTDVVVPFYSATFLTTKLDRIPAVILPIIDEILPIDRPGQLDTWRDSSALVFSRLVAGFVDHVHTSCAITRIAPDAEGVTLTDQHGATHRFDKVVLACPAPAVAQALAAPRWLHGLAMRDLVYCDDNDATFLEGVVHTDPTVIPERDRNEVLAGYCNYISVTTNADGSLRYENHFVLSSWVPAAQGSRTSMFVYYNKPTTLRLTHQQRVISNRRAHPDMRASNLARALLYRFLQGKDGLYYCGSAATPGNGHDLSLLSGLVVAAEIGAGYPFGDDPQARADFGRLRRIMLGRWARNGATRIVALLVLVLALSGCGGPGGGEDETDDEPRACASITAPVLGGAGAQQLELVASRDQIPGLADQPTTRGQVLGVLHAFDGRLHLGYGDYNDNTGPIAMHAWDPQLERFVALGVTPTEEIQRLFAAHGALYSPAIDPDGHEESGGVYRLDCGADAWSVQTAIPGAVHVYDVAAQGDTLYACTGSATGEPALVMGSEDRGASWTTLLSRKSAAGRFSRFYFMAATPELVFVSGRDYPDPGESFAWIRRGAGAFESLATPPSGSLVPITLGDDLVIAGFSGTPGRSDFLGSYRVEGQGFVADQPWPEHDDGVIAPIAWALEDGGRALLVLMERADRGVSVHRSADLSAGAQGWVLLASIEAIDGDAFVSMALLFNDLYLGTREGSLYVLRELEVPEL
jgi:hypothetical protein